MEKRPQELLQQSEEILYELLDKWEMYSDHGRLVKLGIVRSGLLALRERLAEDAAKDSS